MHAPSRRRGGMGIGMFAVAVTSGGFGFIATDLIDRLLATYDPSASEKPKDRFTSDGAGTLANVLNVGSRPTLIRAGAGVGMTALPAIGSMFVDNPYGKAVLQGTAFGAGVSTLNMLWKTLVMPMLVGKDTSVPTLQKSYIARLYPAEVAAKINRTQNQTSVSSAGSGALSGSQDVGPFALADSSPYPSAADALRHQAGVHGDSPYPSASQAIGTHGDSPYPSANQALRSQAGMGYNPGPPDGPGPGPQAEPHKDAACSSCLGDPTMRFSAFLGDSSSDESATR